MATLSQIAVHPIKSLDPDERDRVSISAVGGLAGDRVYAIVDREGDLVNGKRTADVHPIQADFDLDENRVVLSVRGEDTSRQFHLDHDREALEAWLSEYFDIRVELETGPGGALTDSAVLSGSSKGSSLISEATLREVASWYEGIDPTEMRLRLRPNLVVEGVPAFWEDRLFADGGRRFRIGDVTLEGIRPIPRCVVPTRDPKTGTVYEGFRETFLQKREETFPEWGDRDAFEGTLYRLMVGTRIPESERDGELRVGDEVRLADTAAEH